MSPSHSTFLISVTASFLSARPRIIQDDTRQKSRVDCVSREMQKTPVLRFSVPSSSLLKFLRQQTDTCFFTPNAAPKAPLGHKSLCRSSTSKPSQIRTRRLSTTAPCDSSTSLSQCDLASATVAQFNHTGAPNARYASTQSLFRRLLRFRDPNSPAALQPSDIPHRQDNGGHDSQFLNLSRSLARSGASAETKLRCTEFDANGDVTLVSGEFKKSELIAKYGLLPRDLRKIDSSLLPHVLVRKSSILLNLLHLRVLIQADRVLVFDAYGSTDSYTQSLFMYDLEGKLRQKIDTRASTYLPYEFRALEAVLMSVTSGLEAEFVGVRGPVVNVLRDLEEDIDRDKLRHLLIHSKKLGSFEQKARLVRDAISDLLDADDDLAAMYLSERSQNVERDEDNHQEVEMLLESYHKICDEIVESAGNLISNIRNTEEVVKAILDANRNSLMLLEIKFSIGTLGLATGTLVAGLYGMNLKNFLEESDFAFSGVAAICFGMSGLVCLYGMKKLASVQRLRMWGEGYNTAYRPAAADPSRGGWRNEGLESGGKSNDLSLYQRRAERLRLMRERSGSRVLWPGMDGLGSNETAGVGSTGDGDGIMEDGKAFPAMGTSDSSNSSSIYEEESQKTLPPVPKFPGGVQDESQSPRPTKK